MGSTLSTATTFATGVQSVPALAAGIYNFGFRFTNETTAAVNVGCVAMQIATPLNINSVRILG